MARIIHSACSKYKIIDCVDDAVDVYVDDDKFDDDGGDDDDSDDDDDYKAKEQSGCSGRRLNDGKGPVAHFAIITITFFTLTKFEAWKLVWHV